MIRKRIIHTLTTTAVAAALAGGAAAPAAADIETVVLPPRTFAAVNPCTGEPHLVTIAQIRRSHSLELTDPARVHVNDRLAGTIVTSDGFSGTIAEVGIDNAGSPGGEDETGAFGAVIHGIARDSSRLAFSVHAVLHVTVVDGEATVLVDNFRLDCLG